jgi:predicted PurR-regulated permease PerM
MATEKKFVQRALIVVVLTACAFLLLTLFYYVFDILLLIFMAILVAIFLRGSASYLAKYTKISEGLQVGLIVLVLLIVGVVGIIFLAPDVVRQLDELGEGIPASLQKLRESMQAYPQGEAILRKIPDPAALWERIVASGVLRRLGGAFSSTLGAIGNFFVILMLAGYFAATPTYYSQGIAHLFPISKRERVYEILETIYNSLFFWLMGKTASMIFIGVLTFVLLWLLGVPLALVLGILAGLLSFIPNFGPIIAAIPAVLIAFVKDPWLAVWVIGVYVFVQFVESWVVTPFIEKRTVELEPGLTIMFQLVLALLVGTVGLVVATPLLAVIVVLVQMVYVEDVLGDRSKIIPHDEDMPLELPPDEATGEA